MMARSMSITTRATDGGFAEFVRTRRAQIEAGLARFLPGEPQCPPLVAEAMRYSLDAGGKRLRPLLTLATAEAVAMARHEDADAACELALPAACAIELIHTYSLIHDDLPAMDNDTLRRGRPTLHVVYGDGIAILAGDGLLTEAFALMAREPQTNEPGLAERRLRVIARVAEAAGACGMVGGQVVDLEASGTAAIPGRTRRTLDGAGLRAMHAQKTGALIRAAAVAGAILADGTEAHVQAVDRFAADLGLVFQIVDDILDVEGASDELGKTAGKDAAADKPTYPSLFGLEASRALAGDGIARAERTLAEAGLTGNHLLDIADWVTRRRQ
jgi:geranylgeranyl diphosphate synthase, type II